MRTKKCHNCQSDKRRIIARGYCSKCYRYILLIDNSKKWDLNDPATLKGYPHTPELRTKQCFCLIKERVPKQWKDHLDWLHYREKQLNENIDGLLLEEAFQRIARLCGARNHFLFSGYANVFGNTFSLAQRKKLFHFFDMIEQSIPWNGINWHDVFKT